MAADSESKTPTAQATPGQTEADDQVEVSTPEFQNFSDAGTDAAKNSLNQFGDIKITISAELGRAKLPIERLLALGTGSVVELDRSIEGPIELVAQGIPLACGEVVVVNDCFAIRITSVYPRNRKGETLQVER